jgi:hypothetical protein
VVVIPSGGGCRYRMAPKGVVYRKSNSLRKVPGQGGFANYHRKEGIERKGRGNERKRFWMSFMAGASSVRQRLEGPGSSVWFSVDWLRSAERSEPKQRTVIVPCVAVQ